jgi:hypothetical protein
LKEELIIQQHLHIVAVGVQADLATYGKVVGGGMPIGIIAGRTEIMDTFDGGFWQYGDDSFPQAGVTFFAGTFVRHPLAIAATHAALKYIIGEGPALQQRVTDKAIKLTGVVNDLFKKFDVNIELPHFSSQMYLRVKEPGELANLLFFHLRHRGVHILEHFPSYMTDGHTEQDIEHLIRAFTESVELMVEDGIFGDQARLTRDNKIDAANHSQSQVNSSGSTHVSQVYSSDSPTEYSPTDSQKEMWIAAQIRPEASAANNGSNIIELVGELNVSALREAITETVSCHRTIF